MLNLIPDYVKTIKWWTFAVFNTLFFSLAWWSGSDNYERALTTTCDNSCFLLATMNTVCTLAVFVVGLAFIYLTHPKNGVKERDYLFFFGVWVVLEYFTVAQFGQLFAKSHLQLGASYYNSWILMISFVLSIAAMSASYHRSDFGVGFGSQYKAAMSASQSNTP